MAMHIRGTRVLFTIIGAVSGVCFAVLAARAISVLVITPHHFRASSLGFALVTGVLSYRSFGAATRGRTDAANFQRALLGGVVGAVAGFLIVVVLYAMFGQATRYYIAHAFGLYGWQTSMSQLLVAFVCLGFGAGFSLRARKVRLRV